MGTNRVGLARTVEYDGDMDDPTYAAAWRRFRFWRWTFFIIFVSWLAYWPEVEAIFGKGASFWYAAPFVALWFFAAVKMMSLRCPRCGNAFFTGSGFISPSPFDRRCGHCSLRKFAPRDPDAQVPKNAAERIRISD